MSTFRQWIGSILMTLYLFLSLPVYATWLLLQAPFTSRTASTGVAVAWVESVLSLLRVLCRLDYQVEGLQHLERDNTIVLMKHSSAWETVAQFKLFPEQTWVIKRELMWAPFLGWVLTLFKPIAIDRKAGRSAVAQVLEQGEKRLNEGLWVIIFPEGTRVGAGESRRYGMSGALLGVATGRPVIPVAHNAGEFWPRRGWLKHPGTIRVVIGPPIATAGRDARTVNREVQEWIEAKMAEITTTVSSPD